MALTDKGDFNDITEKAIDDLGSTMLDLVEGKAKMNKQNEIIDLQIESVKKSRIRINGDNNSILELNLSDLNIAERLDKGYEKLQNCISKIANMDTEAEDLPKELHTIDQEMREIVDYIFDSNVSEVCCKSGTMFDLKDGVYKFESILEALTKLYSDNLNSEYKTMKKRVQQHTEKYMPQDHKQKSTKRRKEIKGE